jgi:hypothetical protein
MFQARELFESTSTKPALDSADRVAAVETLHDCTEAVTACAGAMVSEENLGAAVSRDMDCADVTNAAAQLLTRGDGPDTSLLSAQLEAALVACERSHELCSKHADHHTHCRICSEATRACADMCRQILNKIHA